MSHDRNEAETRAELIDPAIKNAGWGVAEGSRVRREVITLGRLQGAGTRSNKDIADYVLVYGRNRSPAPSIYAAIGHSTSSVRSVCGYRRSFSFSMRNA